MNKTNGLKIGIVGDPKPSIALMVLKEHQNNNLIPELEEMERLLSYKEKSNFKNALQKTSVCFEKTNN